MNTAHPQASQLSDAKSVEYPAMTRVEFAHARRVAREFHTFAGLMLKAHNDANDITLVKHAHHWFQAEFAPLQAAGIDMAAVWVDTCRGPASGAYGPSLNTLREHPEELRRWLSHFRLRRMGVGGRTRAYPLPGVAT